MPLKSRIDLKKAEMDRLQAIVIDLLREEENKYCADCEAKQPRWGSWNLGVFLCIRCAGIHRNLGVHLTKIKSVNLDSWTPEQVQSMRVMGNKIARRVYEAELPIHFRRPQTDSALESFIRAKYEHKRYILKDWSPPIVDVNDLPLAIDKRYSISDHGSKKSVKRKVAGIENAGSIRVGEISQKSNAAIPNVLINDIPPLLDFSTPPETFVDRNMRPYGEVSDNPLATNRTPLDDEIDGGFDDFGPIVSAPPPPDTHLNVTCVHADASSSKDDNGAINSALKNNFDELASVLGNSSLLVKEKKSTSDILALYGAVPPKFYSQPSSQFPRHIPQAFNGVKASQNPTNANLNSESSLLAEFETVGNFCTPPVLPLVRPAYSSNSSSGGDSRKLVGAMFMNQETAAAFAAASPFADSSIVNSVKRTQSPTLLQAVGASSFDNFVADFSQMNVRNQHQLAGEASVSNDVLSN